MKLTSLLLMAGLTVAALPSPVLAAKASELPQPHRLRPLRRLRQK